MMLLASALTAEAASAPLSAVHNCFTCALHPANVPACNARSSEPAESAVSCALTAQYLLAVFDNLSFIIRSKAMNWGTLYTCDDAEDFAGRVWVSRRKSSSSARCT